MLVRLFETCESNQAVGAQWTLRMWGNRLFQKVREVVSSDTEAERESGIPEGYWLVRASSLEGGIPFEPVPAGDTSGGTPQGDRIHQEGFINPYREETY